MPEPSLPPSLTFFGMLSSHWEAVLAFCGTLGVGLLAWFGSRGTSTAALQQSLNDALRLFMEESQRDRARATAHDLDQQHEIELLQDQLGDARRDRTEAEAKLQLVTRSLVQRGEWPAPLQPPPEPPDD